MQQVWGFVCVLKMSPPYKWFIQHDIDFLRATSVEWFQFQCAPWCAMWWISTQRGVGFKANNFNAIFYIYATYFFIYFCCFYVKANIFYLHLHLFKFTFNFLNYGYDCLQLLRVPRKHPISLKLIIIQYLSCSVLWKNEILFVW